MAKLKILEGIPIKQRGLVLTIQLSLFSAVCATETITLLDLRENYCVFEWNQSESITYVKFSISFFSKLYDSTIALNAL